MKATRTCSVEGCDRDVLARGMCNMHYQRMRNRGSVDLAVSPIILCSVDNCERKYYCNGLCAIHYERLRNRGTIDLLPIRSVADRLAAGLARKPNGCLEWTGSTNARGYGQIKIDGKPIKTHRLAWELANDEIPDGLHVLHHCDVPLCCNPEHLFLGTQADNMADMAAKGRHAIHRVT